MSAIYLLHSANVGTTAAPVKVFFNTSDGYDGLAAETGVTKVADPLGTEVVVPIKELLRTGRLIRVKIRVQDGSNHFYASLLVSRPSLATLFTETSSSLDGKTYTLASVGRGQIERVHFERDRYYRP